jgi:hypothetical protein
MQRAVCITLGNFGKSTIVPSLLNLEGTIKEPLTTGLEPSRAACGMISLADAGEIPGGSGSWIFKVKRD